MWSLTHFGGCFTHVDAASLHSIFEEDSTKCVCFQCEALRTSAAAHSCWHCQPAQHFWGGQYKVCIFSVWSHYHDSSIVEIWSGAHTFLCGCKCLGLTRTVYTVHTVYEQIFGHFPAKNTVDTSFIQGSGQLKSNRRKSRPSCTHVIVTDVTEQLKRKSRPSCTRVIVTDVTEQLRSNSRLSCTRTHVILTDVTEQLSSDMTEQLSSDVMWLSSLAVMWVSSLAVMWCDWAA